MGIFSYFEPKQVKELRARVSELEARAAGGVNVPNDLFNALFGDDSSGKVTIENAKTLSSIYQAITIHCNSLNIPVGIFKKLDGDYYPVTQDDKYEFQVNYLLHTSPNLMMTPSQWFQLMEMSRLLYGNGYSFIWRDNFTATPKALIWIHPERIEVVSNGVELKYNIKNDGTSGYWYQNVRALDMIHIKATSFNGITGESPIDIARNSLEFGMQTQIAGNKFFRSGMRQAIVLTHPAQMNPDSQKRLGQQFDSQLKSEKTIVLEEGVKPTTLSFSPEQSQFLLSREFGVNEVARWFNLPEDMLENNARATFSNIEHKMLWFLMNNVRPRLRMYEQEFNWKLLGNDPDFNTEFNMNALLRADAASRAAYYVQVVQNGIMNRNEIRRLENLNSIPGGDDFLTPMNLATDAERKEKDTEGTAPDIENIESIKN